MSSTKTETTRFTLKPLSLALISASLLIAAPLAMGHDHDDHGHSHDEHGDDDHDETRQLGAHVHGAAQLLVAVDNDHVDVMLESPSFNVVGFEHFARNDADREALREAEEKLLAADPIFRLTSAANCSLEHVELMSEQVSEMRGEEVDVHYHGDGDDHGHDDLDDHGHDDHGQDEHGHDSDQRDDSVHTEFNLEYRFHCDNIADLNGLDVTAFDHFSNFEQVDVQWIVDGHQGAHRTQPGRTTVRF